MGIVTARSDFSGIRDIYFPASERGMAHFSYLSPDKKWVLLAEMEPQWHPCRVVPFDGGSQGVQVGPTGECTSAAWSPDGKWVYLGVKNAGRQHIWRQRFPGGQPEQVTSGSTEESGIAMAPDGRSLITSIFTRQNAVWMHDSHGDHAISTQGYVDQDPHLANFTRPEFSRDGKRLYYSLRRDAPESPAEIWVADLATGKSKDLLPGVSVREFDISPDEKEVVYTAQPLGQDSEVWVTPLDRSTPPRRIATGGAAPRFGLKDEIVFRHVEGNAMYLAAVRHDGTGQRHAFPRPVEDVDEISPDRRFIIVRADAGADQNLPSENVFAVPLDGVPRNEFAEVTANRNGRQMGAIFILRSSRRERRTVPPRNKWQSFPSHQANRCPIFLPRCSGTQPNGPSTQASKSSSTVASVFHRR
jgi:hypothetical protein